MQLGHFIGRTTGNDPACAQVDDPVAEALDHAHVMGDEQQRRAFGRQFFQPIQAFELKRGIADGQGFIDDQDLGLDTDRNGEGQPYQHPAGIDFGGLVDKVADIGKGEDIFEAGVDFRATQAQHRRIHIDVFPAGELRIETGPQLEQRGNPAMPLDTAPGWHQRSADQLQQGGFTTAITADDTDGLPLAMVRETSSRAQNSR